MSTVQGYQGVPYSKADEHLIILKKTKQVREIGKIPFLNKILYKSLSDLEAVFGLKRRGNLG
jgi:hypothetical protein